MTYSVQLSEISGTVILFATVSLNCERTSIKMSNSYSHPQPNAHPQQITHPQPNAHVLPWTHCTMECLNLITLIKWSAVKVGCSAQRAGHRTNIITPRILPASQMRHVNSPGILAHCQLISCSFHMSHNIFQIFYIPSELQNTRIKKSGGVGSLSSGTHAGGSLMIGKCNCANWNSHTLSQCL